MPKKATAKKTVPAPVEPVQEAAVSKNEDDAKNLLESLLPKEPTYKGSGGLYRRIASDGKASLMVSVRYEPMLVPLPNEGKKAIHTIGMFVRFVADTNETPVPAREGMTHEGEGIHYMKKYAIPVAVGPVNGFIMRDVLTTSGIIQTVYDWIAKRVDSQPGGWKMTMPFDGEDSFLQMALQPFDGLPESQPELFQLPEW